MIDSGYHAVNTNPQPPKPGTFADALVPVVVVSLLIFLPAMSCLLRGDAGDPDVWWHLKAGEWILEQGSLPTEDAFSSHGQGNAWTAYSWAAEVALAGLHRAFGLRGIQEQVDILGGMFRIAGVRGKGTTATVRLPLRRA